MQPNPAFSTYDVQTCLYDARRVGYLREAIVRVIQARIAAVGPDTVVVDAGSGTGLLGLLAAAAGAARVYCVELNPAFRAVIAGNARDNGMTDRVYAICADATRWQPPEPVDVLICETISAGFWYEPQLQIINNLRPWLRPGGVVVPLAMRNHVELAHAQEELYGLRFTCDTRFVELPDDRTMSKRSCYLSTRFAAATSVAIDSRVQVRAFESGQANAVRITYDIEFASGVFADTASESLLNPQIIFLPQPVRLDAGRTYDVSLTYRAGDNPLACDIQVGPAG